MSKLARLIAQEEGYGIPGALPTRNNNPGDLRHSPHSFHRGDPNAVGQIDTPEHGWEDLERQLKLFAGRGLSLREMIYLWAPPEENHTEKYLAFICQGLGCSADTLISKALEIEDEQPHDLRERGSGGLDSSSAPVVAENSSGSGHALGRSSSDGDAGDRSSRVFFSSSANRRRDMNIGDGLKQLVDLAKNDVLKAALPALATFFNNIAQNPSAVNIAGQLAKLQIDLLTALPSVEKDLLTSIANMINEQVASLPK